MPGIITLTTDFGTRDGYVGAMKGAILSVNPHATVVDISHDIAPQDVVEAAWVLASAYRFFPPETVHVVVVDPGVGSDRLAVAARAGGWHFVGPDNGVLTWATVSAGETRAVELRERRWFRPEVSATFHGRDVFGPVAAHLAAGVPLDAFGPGREALTPLPLPSPTVQTDVAIGEVIHVDRFGNLITNITKAVFTEWARGDVTIAVGDEARVGLGRTYADVAPGEALALFGSTGHLEIAVRDGDAAARFGVGRGSAVVVRNARDGM
jgi:hypothetical protein